jgi:hypothetical protein
VSAKFGNGFAHLLLLIPAFAIVSLVAAANVHTTQNFPRQNPAVLGDNSEGQQSNSGGGKSQENKSGGEENKSENKEGEKHEEPKRSENSRSDQKPQTATLVNRAPSNSGPGTIKNQVKIENGKTETEFENPGGQKVKTKTEDDGTTKVEIEQGKVKIKYVVENGKVILKARDQSGKEIELEDRDLKELEQEKEDNGIKVATESGQIRFGRNQNALTNFPLSVNPLTHELIVTTPAGEKIVTVLPDQAVANLLSTNVVNLIEASGSAGTSTADSIKLTEKNGEAVYEINGIKTHRLLGFIPINTKVKAFVSAENGDLVAKEESLVSRFLDTISPNTGNN